MLKTNYLVRKKCISSPWPTDNVDIRFLNTIWLLQVLINFILLLEAENKHTELVIKICVK